jgi:hypothetical protein
LIWVITVATDNEPRFRGDNDLVNYKSAEFILAEIVQRGMEFVKKIYVISRMKVGMKKNAFSHAMYGT